MGQQFWYLVTLQGATVPSIIAVASIAAIVVGGVINNRGAAGRRRSWRARQVPQELASKQ